MFLAAGGEISLHRGGKRIDVTVGVAASEIVAGFGKRIVIEVVEILQAELFVARAGSALIRKEEIFGDGVGLV
jgi:septum formation inhibitor-activating ATPase MinD